MNQYLEILNRPLQLICNHYSYMPEEHNITETALFYQMAPAQSSNSMYSLLSLLVLAPCIALVGIIGRCIYSKCCYKTPIITPLSPDSSPVSSLIRDTKYLVVSPSTDRLQPDDKQQPKTTLSVSSSLLNVGNVALPFRNSDEEIKSVLYPFGPKPQHVSSMRTSPHSVIPRHIDSQTGLLQSKEDTKTIMGDNEKSEDA